MATTPTKGRNRPTNFGILPANSGFDARDERLAFALARGLTRLAAAKEVGITDRTVYARLTNPEFRRLVADCRGRMLDEAYGQLVASLQAANDVIKAVMEDGEQPGSTRLRAAVEIIDNMITIGSFSDHDRRIAELERRTADAQPEREA